MMTLALAIALTASQVADTAQSAKPLQPGAHVPEVALMTIDSTKTTLKDALGGKKTVLVFYRGGWCPFCNAHLADLGANQQKFEDAGWQIVGITPDLPQNIVNTEDKHKLTFKIYSDSKAEALKAFGVAFRVDDGTYTMYKDKYHLDLEKWSGDTSHILPVPSVFLVDAQGVIRFTHADPDYKVRMKADEILGEMKKVDG